MEKGSNTAEIQYTVDARDHRLNNLRVEMLFRPPRGSVELCMPVWTPGAYRVEDFAKHIVEIDAFNSAGRRIALEKSDKSSWVLNADGRDITVKYRVHAHTITVHHSFFDDTHLTINGASVFLYARGMESQPATVRLIPHDGWNAVSTGLRHTEDKWTFRAENYDTLVDSPIEAGNHESIHFKCMEKDHEIAIYGSSTIDTRKFASDVEKIVRAQISIMKNVPYERYVFIYDLLPGASGGLEHLNSTHCLADPFSFRIREEYIAKLSTISHEFFHLWNVKRLRPVPLGPFDYSKEVYTKLLWFSEGFTSYYTYIALRKARIQTPAEFMRSNARTAEIFLQTPGRNYQSAEESSFDTWIKFYRPDENTVNSVISYYTKGQLIGMLLDIHIIDGTGGRRRLDDVMRLLYRKTYGEGKGFTEEDFIESLSEVCDGDGKTLYRKLVASRGDLPLARYLALAGLEMKWHSERKAACLGIRMSENSPEIVDSVIEGMGAAEAGVLPGDEIIAVNGMRAKARELKNRIAEFSPGENIRLTVSRHGLMKDIEVKASEKPGQLRFVQNQKAGERQRRNYEKWSYSRWKEGLDYDKVRDPASHLKRNEML